MKKSGKNSSNWTFRYHPAVLHKDLTALDIAIARRIKQAIDLKLSVSPHLYGMPLRGSLKGLLKLRVGDWRIIYKISAPYVDILCIGDRKDIYERLRRRFGL